MLVMLTVFKHTVTFGTSTVMYENSFSTLKNVFDEYRWSMMHQQLAHLIQLLSRSEGNTPGTSVEVLGLRSSENDTKSNSDTRFMNQLSYQVTAKKK
ncbi:hypothetical protein PHYPO_G00076990 [Pangasianodon hypophthalmus]|uniref:Uncharacterized protein n=1 Tax=Pangasianodon hypophthalmus TaxID=310915 RepID=A0A5N5LKV4_PANHP|nr:hypothetical protein PHYPO_G00076990 [Pangasianodon hypophthalmus]